MDNAPGLSQATVLTHAIVALATLASLTFAVTTNHVSSDAYVATMGIVLGYIFGNVRGAQKDAVAIRNESEPTHG